MTDHLHSMGRVTDYPTTIPPGLAIFGPKEWRQRVAVRIGHEPTEDDWKAYHRGVELLNELRDNPFFSEGGTDYGSSVEQPITRLEIVYAETHDEWRQRVTDMARERGGFPQQRHGGRTDWASVRMPATPSDLLYSPKGTQWTHEDGPGESK